MCKFYFGNNFGKCGPILIILSTLLSVMNCRVSCYKISHLSLNLLLHYLAKFKCSKYIPLQQFDSKVVQNLLSTVHINERWYLFIHMCMQFNCSMSFKLSDFSKHACFESCTQHVSGSADDALFNAERSL